MIDGVKTRYAYKPDGLRISKTTGNDTTRHIWDGSNISADMQNNIVTGRYIRGVELLISIDNSNAKTTYLHNAHGDVTLITNVSGTVLWKYEYDAFGVEKEIAGQDPETDTNPFRYCGEYFDKETGSIYLRARYYNPKIGRFITQDPINDGLNWYTYCGNEPVMRWDPTGLKGEWIRNLADAVGGKVDWDSDTNVVTVTIAGVSREYKNGEDGVSIDNKGRMYVDGTIFAEDFSEINMTYGEFSGTGFSGFTLSLTQSFSTPAGYGGTGISSMVVNIHDTVDGERLANQMNSNQNTAASILIAACDLGLTVLSSGLSKAAVGGASLASGFVLPFVDLSDGLAAGETIITQTRVTGVGMSRPSYTQTTIIKDVDYETRITKRKTYY